MPVFVDTNVLVYARDLGERDKHVRAAAWVRHLWDSGQGRLSFQVLQEYYVTVTAKLRPGLSPGAAMAEVRDLLTWRPVVIDAIVLEDGWAIQDRYGLTFWDSLVVAAARRARCTHLLTEDLQHGQDLDGVRVVDPFRVSPDESA